jgi:hypothetical protein
MMVNYPDFFGELGYKNFFYNPETKEKRGNQSILN